MSLKARNSKNARKGYRAFETLEDRRLFAAHIAGNATVYATIQAAVDAAKPGAVIDVDAGTYSENVGIYKALTLRGAQAGLDARSNRRLSGAAETILNGQLNSDGTRSSAFYVAADNVTLDGFIVQEETSQSLTYGAGIVIGPKVAGAHIYNNIVQNNVAGLFLSSYSTTNAAIIQHNVFRYNNNPGVNGGRGIYSDGVISGGNLTNVLIDANAFVGNYGSTGTTGLEGAIAIESRLANSQSNITVSNNTFDYNGKAVLFYNATQITVSNNMVSWCRDHFSAALRFEGGMTNVSVKSNTVYMNPGPAVRVDQKGFGGGNSGFRVNGNNFFLTDTNYSPRYALIVGSGQYSGTFDATGNYWGSSTGPSGAGSGLGDGVQSNGNSVDFSKWATSPLENLQVPYLGLPWSAGANIEAENYDHGGEGIGYHDLDTSNSGNKYRIQGVDIESTNDVGGGYDVGWTRAGEWLAYTIDLTSGGTFDLSIRLANANAGASFHVEIDGVNVTGGIAIPSTGGYQNFTTLTQSNLSVEAGMHLLRLVFDASDSAGSAGNYNWLKLTNTSVSSFPAAPSGLIATALGATSVNLSWRDNSSNESGFVIERKVGSSGAWTTLASTSANITLVNDNSVQPATSYTYRVRATSSSDNSGYSNEFSVTTPAQTSSTYLSDLPFYGTTINGWGPVERDQNVGASSVNDGGTLTLNGVTYAKGLGAHAYSEVSFNLGGAYAQFISDLGIDDRQTTNGTVVFQVFGDGIKLYDSGIMTATSATKTLTVDTTGVMLLKLIVTDAGDGIDYDHADWANARVLTAAAPAPTPTPAPTVPANLTATLGTGQIKLAWADNATNEDGFRIERSTDNLTFSQVASLAANIVSYSDTNATVAGTTYSYRIVAYNAAGNSAYSNVAAALVPLTNALPAPWKAVSIGPVQVAGAASYSNGVYTVKGAGSTIGGTADSFQYAYQSKTGDGQIVARVTGITNTNAGALAGIMYRNGTASNAKEVGLFVTPTGSVVFTRRSSTGGTTQTTTLAGATGPTYLKLTRKGNTFTAYRSANGTIWTLIGSANVSMPSTVNVGLAVCSRNSTTLNTATFDNVLL